MRISWSLRRPRTLLAFAAALVCSLALTASYGDAAFHGSCGSRAAGGSRARSLVGLAYRTIDGEALALDAFLPAGLCGPRPALILIHGGGWTTGRRGWLDDVAAQAAALGYVGFSIDYRLAPAHPFPAQLDDVLAAIRWVQANAARFGVDPGRIGLYGSSAGASLAALAAAVAAGRGISGVRAAVSLSGMLDLPAFLKPDQNPDWGTSTFADYLGCAYAACPGRYRAASPSTFVGPRTPPLFIANSSDELVPLAQATELDAKLTAAGVPHRLVVVPGDGHGTAYSSVVWPLVVDFLRRFLGPVPGSAAAAAPARSLAVERENDRVGTTGWQIQSPSSGTIWGYASAVSVLPGEQLQLHVSVNPAQRYRVRVYRLGWYGGRGGRLVACFPGCQADLRGESEDVPAPDPQTGELQLDWPVTSTILVQRTWLSGYYFAQLDLTTGPDAGTGTSVPFIVRAAPGSRPSAILVQAAVNTWQAYNGWGGKSLYNNFTGYGDNHVSFDRPYDLVNQGPLSWEAALVRFLEQEGYDVSYTTDVDTDREPAELLRHRLVMTAGHDEYWTKTIRDAFERARDAGVNLAFMGANTGYWQIRYEDDQRTIVEYRKFSSDPDPDPAEKTVRFRTLGPPRPECQLLGVQYTEPPMPDKHGVVPPPPPPNGPITPPGAYAVVGSALNDPWWAHTNLTDGELLPGLVGYEQDAVVPGCAPAPLTVFFHNETPGSNADAVRYTAPSGARVFSAGSLQFAWGLGGAYGQQALRNLPDTDGEAKPQLQQFMRNAIDDLAAAHAGNPSPTGR